MEGTSIVRCLDQLGRICLPSEYKETLDVGAGTPLAILTEDENIILQKYEPGCVICGSLYGLKNFKGKNVCSKCISDF